MAQEVIESTTTDTVQESGLMNLIADMARDKSSDVAKLEKLINLQNDVLGREAKKSFARAYVKMKPELPRVISLHKNTQTNSQYAKLEDINRIIDPILSKFGFATQHKVISQTEKMIRVRIELWHEDGHIESTELEMPPDDSGIAGKVNKTQPHAIASTIMYLRRVGECALLNISTGQDFDGNLPNSRSAPITTEQAAGIDMRLRALGGDTLANFKKWMKVEDLRDIPQSELQKCLNALSDKEKQVSESHKIGD